MIGKVAVASCMGMNVSMHACLYDIHSFIHSYNPHTAAVHVLYIIRLNVTYSIS